MNTSQQVKRQESDRLKPSRWYSAIFARPEIDKRYWNFHLWQSRDSVLIYSET